MAAPLIVSTDPVSAATAVTLNKTIKVTFDQAMLQDSIVPAHFILRHVSSNTIIRCGVTYNPSDFSVTIVPASQFWENSTFRLSVIGASSSSATGGVKNSSSETLVTTYSFDFQTGSEVEAPNSKTTAELAAEGDLRLPAGIEIRSINDFALLDSSPANGSWGYSGNILVLNFSSNISTEQASQNIVVRTLPFLDEDGWFANAKSDGTMVFEWQTESWSSEPSLFTISPWQVDSIVSGNVTLINSGTIPKNAVIEVTVYKNLQDTLGNYLDDSYQVIFTTESYPNYVTPRSIRNEIFSVFETLNLEWTHQLVWKWMIDAYRLVGLRNNLAGEGKYIKDYVKCGAVLDIMKSMIIEKSLLAGQTKTLGDFSVAYHPNAVELGKNSIYNQILAKFKKAERAIGYHSGLPQSFIRSWNSPTDPVNFRTRLWKNPRVLNNHSGHRYPSRYPVANTQEERDHVTPGSWDLWS